MLELEFDKLIEYNAGQIGIEIDVSLQMANKTVNLKAQIDTGASRCLFKRKLGEELGFEIEKGMAQRFGTATGGFLAYGHEVTLIVAGFEFYSMVFFAENEYFDRSVLGRIGSIM